MEPRIRAEVLGVFFLKDYASLIKIGNIIHCSAWLEGAKWWHCGKAAPPPPPPLKSG